MKFCLENHEYKYALEQILLAMFPREKHQLGRANTEEDGCVSKLFEGKVYTTVVTRLRIDGKEYLGKARTRTPDKADKLERDRELQKIVKRSFYVAARPAVGGELPWGAMTGIRPSKIAAGFLDLGMTREETARQLQKEYYVSPKRAELCTETAMASVAARKSLNHNEISLYIGIPFCPTRCAYCSFVSQSVEKTVKLIEPFVEALLREIAVVGEEIKRIGWSPVSIYMGGGTPTTLSAEQLKRIFDELSKRFNLSAVREFTVEAGRPDTIDEEKLRVIKNGGATRISINPQTMQEHVLKAIGRKHTPDDVILAYELARKVDIGEINMDLIAGLPEDDVIGFSDTVDRIIQLAPENITVHTLSIKKGSNIDRGEYALPGGETVEKMLEFADKRLRSTGYTPYYLYRQKYMSGAFENIGWSLHGKEGLYNICMMEELQSIIAMGAGGVTKLVNPQTRRIERIFNVKYPYEYIDGIEKVLNNKRNLDKMEVFHGGY